MQDNFYLGGTEYKILYRNGSWLIINCYEYENDIKGAIVFTGNYYECLEYREKMETGYQQSLF